MVFTSGYPTHTHREAFIEEQLRLKRERKHIFTSSKPKADAAAATEAAATSADIPAGGEEEGTKRSRKEEEGGEKQVCVTVLSCGAPDPCFGCAVQMCVPSGRTTTKWRPKQTCTRPPSISSQVSARLPFCLVSFRASFLPPLRVF